MIIIFISIISIILALVHFVIFKALISLLSLSLMWKLIIGVLLTVLCFSFVVSSILTFNFNNSFTKFFYTTSSIWLGLAFYLFLASSLYILLNFIFQKFGINISSFVGILFFAIAILTSVYGVFHARSIFVKNIELPLSNLPIEWEGRRAVYISDIHLGAIFDKSYAEKIVNKINEINPDVVFIGGDLYDGVKVDEKEVLKPFENLHPKLGTYFITGNHEEFRDNKVYLSAVESVGIHPLNNEMVTIEGVQLIGVDDRDSINVPKFKSILTSFNIDKNKPSILLKHQPFQLEEAKQAGISLQISGHTHRAQMFPLNIFTKLIYQGYDYGLKMWENMTVFTSSGVGTWGPPIRVGSDNEIIVLEFKNKI